MLCLLLLRFQHEFEFGILEEEEFVALDCEGIDLGECRNESHLHLVVGTVALGGEDVFEVDCTRNILLRGGAAGCEGIFAAHSVATRKATKRVVGREQQTRYWKMF